MSSPAQRRSYGTGSLRSRPNRHGGETWYAQIRIEDRFIKRVIGPKRAPGGSDGLTKRDAEARVRELIAELRAAPPIEERMTLEAAARARIDHLDRILGRKRTTIQDYTIMLERHFVPFFADKQIDRITPDDVMAYIGLKQREGLAIKTINNQLNFLHSIFVYAMKRRWARENPVAAVDRPRMGDTDRDIHFLTLVEFEALLEAIPDDDLGRIEYPLYLAAAMTGLRQGELIGLRWRDVDFDAGVIRCRQIYTRGNLGTPKTRRSSRAVPMADRLAEEIEALRTRAEYEADDDLVFCHPQTGNVYDPSRLRKRYKAALEMAGVREVRFHDLRHTFGTHMAAAGAPLRAIQEWMGHADYKTTSIYADYAPDSTQGRAFAERAFGPPRPKGRRTAD